MWDVITCPSPWYLLLIHTSSYLRAIWISKPEFPHFRDCVNTLRPSHANMRHQPMPSLVQIMAYRMFGAKPLSVLLSIGPLGTNFSQIVVETQTFSFKKMHLKMSSGQCRPCVKSHEKTLLRECYFTWRAVRMPILPLVAPEVVIMTELHYYNFWLWVACPF